MRSSSSPISPSTTTTSILIESTGTGKVDDIEENREDEYIKTQGIQPLNNGEDDDQITDDRTAEIEEADQEEQWVPPPPPPPGGADRVPRARALPRPHTPTKVEKELHDLTHLPFRDWCEHCVKARAKNLPHRKVRPHMSENTVPFISMDFAFLRRHDSEEKRTIIVARDHRTRMTFAHALQGKSTVNESYSNHVLQCIIADLKYLDYKKSIVKSDQGNALDALRERIRQVRAGLNEQTLQEYSPVGESQSNGTVEKAVQEVEEMLATLLSALEKHLGGRIPLEAPVVAWMISYAATLINYYRVGKDGRTPLERHRGEKTERPLAEFGELVHYLPLDRKNNTSHSPDVKYEDGVWLGVEMQSTEAIIGTPSGIVRARSVKRRPEDVRWSMAEILAIQGSPWDPTPGVAPELLRAPMLPPRDPDAVVPDLQPPTEPGLTGRRVRLTAEDFARYDYTPGCGACISLATNGTTRKGHSAICRERMENCYQNKVKVEEGSKMATAGLLKPHFARQKEMSELSTRHL